MFWGDPGFRDKSSFNFSKILESKGGWQCYPQIWLIDFAWNFGPHFSNVPSIPIIGMKFLEKRKFLKIRHGDFFNIFQKYQWHQYALWRSLFQGGIRRFEPILGHFSAYDALIGSELMWNDKTHRGKSFFGHVWWNFSFLKQKTLKNEQKIIENHVVIRFTLQKNAFFCNVISIFFKMC